MMTQGTLSRRTLLGRIGATVGALALVIGLHGHVEAGRSWCRVDPVVKIDGKVADIWLSGDLELDRTATGPAQIVVSVPVGVSTELLATDNGFNKQGYAITFVEDATLVRGDLGPQVMIWASVPAPDGTLPLEVIFAPRSLNVAAGSAMGTASGVTLVVS